MAWGKRYADTLSDYSMSWEADGKQRTTRLRTERQVPARDIAAEHSLANVHSPTKCLGRGCSIHHPSGHHMRDWPMVWRSFRGYFERQCKHGVGHPDPDDMAYLVDVSGPKWHVNGAHSCCGCCQPDFNDNEEKS